MVSDRKSCLLFIRVILGCTATSSEEIRKFLLTQDSDSIMASFGLEAKVWPYVDGHFFKEPLDQMIEYGVIIYLHTVIYKIIHVISNQTTLHTKELWDADFMLDGF